ncbi:MAG: GIY-YIG nuclease family protein [Candidatus Eremiobacteraeota bacterium]|nr:GIY-YIG nuclease family protein [Candidatus Eremiobacteraeota bacterium]
MFISSSFLSNVPKYPAVYAMYGGTGRSQYVAYVGIAKNLRQRLEQHLIRRDSSVTTGTSASTLNPDYVTEIRWWTHSRFSDRAALEAAEIIAFNLAQLLGGRSISWTSHRIFI